MAMAMKDLEDKLTHRYECLTTLCACNMQKSRQCMALQGLQHVRPLLASIRI